MLRWQSLRPKPGFEPSHGIGFAKQPHPVNVSDSDARNDMDFFPCHEDRKVASQAASAATNQIAIAAGSPAGTDNESMAGNGGGAHLLSPIQ